MIQGKRWNFLLIKHQVNSLKIKILKNFPFFFLPRRNDFDGKFLKNDLPVIFYP